MAVDMFIKIDGVEGESTDQSHAREIDVLAWSWGMSQSGSMHSGGGGGSGKVSVQDISFTKYLDKASPILLKKCCKGDHIPKAVLTVRKAGGGAEEYLTLELNKVLISSVSTGGSGGEDRLTENITLNFAEFKQIYKPQTDTGVSGGAVDVGWSIEQNAEI